MAEIVLEGVSKRYPDGTEAVARLDLSIRDGEFFILVGPSGCGKSTLLKMIVGLEEPTTGEIRVDGQPVNHLDPKDRNMAMVFQSYAIYPHMTVRENMAFPLKLSKMGRREVEDRVARAAEILRIEDLLDRRPAALSGGQRQRVAMGRAIVREPLAFLLDEPLSNLDAKLRVRMRSEIARLQSQLGTTTIYVTHDQTEAMTLGDDIAVLNEGQLQQVGTPRDLYELPENLFVAGFIGSPAMNFLPGRVEGSQLLLPMLELPLTRELREIAGGDEGEWVVGLRPEAFRPVAGVEAAEAPSFTGVVELVEWMGAESFVHVRLPDPPEWARPGSHAGMTRESCDGEGFCLVARLPGSSRAAKGESLTLGLDPARVMLFHPDTGKRSRR